MDESDDFRCTAVLIVTDDHFISANVTNNLKTLPVTKNRYLKNVSHEQVSSLYAVVLTF